MMASSQEIAAYGFSVEVYLMIAKMLSDDTLPIDAFMNLRGESHARLPLYMIFSFSRASN